MFDWFRKKEDSAGEGLKEILSGYELPSFPVPVMNALGMLRNPESMLEEISMHIEMDPGIHVRVLKAVNSAAFGLSSEVRNISHAITLLGRSRLESLLLSVAAKGVVPVNVQPGFDLNQFWFASAKRASLARALGRLLHPATQAESFTAGLLQDIAVLVLSEVNGAKYNEVYSEWLGNPKSRLDELEREVFGYDHAGVGALMAQEWGLQDYLARMIAGHMDPARHEDVAPGVRLVSCIRGGDENDGSDILIDSCCAEFGMNHERIRSLVNRAIEDAEQFCEML